MILRIAGTSYNQSGKLKIFLFTALITTIDL